MHCTGTRRQPCSTRLGTAIALVVAPLLSGCIPAPYGSYLRPAYPDPSSVLSKAACGGQAGPPTTLTFTAPGDVAVTVVGRRASGGKGHTGWLAAIAIKPAANAGFRFVSHTVRVGGSPGDLDEIVQPSAEASISQRFDAKRWIEVNALGPTSLEAAQAALTDRPGSDLAEARVGFGTYPGAPQRMRVVLPALLTPRERFEVPPQDLVADASQSAYQALRSTEYAAALAQQEARCRAETPGRACENITRVAPYSFRHDAGPFTWLGRFWNFRGEKQEPLRFELIVQARTAQPWRLAEPIVRMTDEASGETKQQAFADMHVALRYPVPIDARLRGARPGMSITVPLETSRSRYFIQLPPYDTGGQRYELKPIELELRRFDGGLEPFNC